MILALTFVVKAQNSWKKDSLIINSLIEKAINSSDSNYFYSIQVADSALRIATKAKHAKAMLKCYNRIADIHWFHSNYSKAEEYYFKEYKLSDSMKYEAEHALSLYNLGWIYVIQQGNFSKISYLRNSLAMRIKLKDTSSINRSLNSMANAYNKRFSSTHDKKDFDSALFYFNMALAIMKNKPKYTYSKAVAYGSLGALFETAKDYKTAYFYSNKSLELAQKCKDSSLIIFILFDKSAYLVKLDSNEKGLQLALKVNRLAANSHLEEHRINTLKVISDAKYKLKDYLGAYDFLLKFTALDDSIERVKQSNNLLQLENLSEMSKKENDLRNLTQEKEIQELKSKRKTIYISLLGLIGFVIVVVAYLLFRQNKLKQYTNTQLTEQNKIISEKKNEIEQSIEYAKGIQTSFLPDKELLDIFIPSNFIFYQPKDVVSGDFYWFQTSKNKKQILLACADSTGHGVPGALMSMVGINMLQQFCGTEKLNHPSTILKNLNNEIKNALKQNSEQSKQRDGMDIALIFLDLETKKLLFSSANRPLYIIRNKELLELKPTKCAIGGFTNYNQEFEEMEMELISGDFVVMTTDGYADQFGGENGKKLMTKKLKELLVKVSSHNSHEQYKLIKEAFNNWKGTYNQVDDVCIVSFVV